MILWLHWKVQGQILCPFHVVVVDRNRSGRPLTGKSLPSPPIKLPKIQAMAWYPFLRHILGLSSRFVGGTVTEVIIKMFNFLELQILGFVMVGNKNGTRNRRLLLWIFNVFFKCCWNSAVLLLILGCWVGTECLFISILSSEDRTVLFSLKNNVAFSMFQFFFSNEKLSEVNNELQRQFYREKYLKVWITCFAWFPN